MPTPPGLPGMCAHRLRAGQSVTPTTRARCKGNRVICVLIYYPNSDSFRLLRCIKWYTDHSSKVRWGKCVHISGYKDTARHLPQAPRLLVWRGTCLEVVRRKSLRGRGGLGAERGVLASAVERGGKHMKLFQDFRTEKLPESGLGCLMCAELIRQLGRKLSQIKLNILQSARTNQ